MRLSRLATLLTVLVFAAALLACGGSTPAQEGGKAADTPTVAAEEEAQAPADVSDSSAAEEESLSEEGMDLTDVDVCALVPVADVEAIVGKLRNPPKQTTTIDREKGCSYIENAHGHFYEITLYPLDQWGLAKYTLKDPKPLEGVGDGAYVAAYSDALMLHVLVKDRVIINIRVSDDNQDTALALYELALKHLP